MERQRFGKVSIWADLWRLIVLCGAVFSIVIAGDAPDGDIFYFLAKRLFVGIGIILFLLFLLFSIFVREGTVLETDGTFLYVVGVYCFKEQPLLKIKIEDITKITFVGDRTISVIIQYGDGKYCLKVKKDDKAYKYLLDLANMRGINQQNDKLVEETKQSQSFCRIGKIILILIIVALLWFYRSEITWYILALGILVL
ncbi:MAG: hypothetical protein NC218_00760 [Acetobacter sp.]|nr:hypothetical protein [Acetobacter sp.]